MTEYVLPSHQSVQCQDRFSILSQDELEVPFWSFLECLLSQEVRDIDQLIDLLEILAVCRSGKTVTDYGFLRQYLAHNRQDMDRFIDTWPIIVAIALDMPMLFQGSVLRTLRSEDSSVQLSRRQVACLVIHQFLCTLTAPSWQDGYQDFHIWFSSSQPHAGAVSAYLKALFTYFARLPTLVDGAHDINYSLRSACPEPSADSQLCKLEVIQLLEQSTDPSVLGLGGGATVISANKFVGFGRTGTQEEVHVGCTPEACPVVLFTPPLKDGQALVTRGCEAMISIKGYGREARLDRVLEPGRYNWRRRTMLFADALELDMVDDKLLIDAQGQRGLADLLPGMVERELKKARLAFMSDSLAPAYDKLYTGFWGCRTFGGNPGVKACIQWCAASLAGVDKVKFVCNGEEQALFGVSLADFVMHMGQVGTTARQLEQILMKLKVNECKDQSCLEIVLARMKSDSLISEDPKPRD